MVGISGATIERRELASAIGLSLPARMCGSVGTRPSTLSWICPATRSMRDCVLPLYGTCSMGTARRRLGPDRAARSRPVLDDHCAAEALRELLTDEAGERVTGSAGGERDDDLDGF